MSSAGRPRRLRGSRDAGPRPRLCPAIGRGTLPIRNRADLIALRRSGEIADDHVLDHVPATWARARLGHAILLTEARLPTPRSSDRTLPTPYGAPLDDAPQPARSALPRERLTPLGQGRPFRWATVIDSVPCFGARLTAPEEPSPFRLPVREQADRNGFGFPSPKRQQRWETTSKAGAASSGC